MFTYTFPSNSLNGNSRFSGSVIVTIENQELIIPASEFELAEADTRSLGDGDKQYEELWIADAPIDEDTGDRTNFDRIQVNVIRFNNGPFEFYGQAEVIGGPKNRVQVDDELELNEQNKQSPSLDPY